MTLFFWKSPEVSLPLAPFERPVLPESSIEAGKVYRLKSGGPKITAQHRDLYGTWWFAWFDGSEVKRDTFQEASVEEARGL